jgi:hypothetical protein
LKNQDAKFAQAKLNSQTRQRFARLPCMLLQEFPNFKLIEETSQNFQLPKRGQEDECRR